MSAASVLILFHFVLCQHSENSPRDPATVAYAKVFAAHHGWAVRKTCSCCKNVCPLSKAQLLKKLNKHEASVMTYMQTYIRSSGPVIMYVEELYNSRQNGDRLSSSAGSATRPSDLPDRSLALPVYPSVCSDALIAQTLRDPAIVAYAKVFVAHHGWAVWKACSYYRNVCPSVKSTAIEEAK
ncbi:hypothetical protein ZIOFF_012927 [Zingiber officinale]|uniref:Glycolipid transfer protein domain-containing protein n=1 Tax=Zingiber officinale TaxID=94328 RepID=A0A8J5HJ07_ZINOF|nr:hypothetical protein ZIOFF_012927 [Zingiber officinale]